MQNSKIFQGSMPPEPPRQSSHLQRSLSKQTHSLENHKLESSGYILNIFSNLKLLHVNLCKLYIITKSNITINIAGKWNCVLTYPKGIINQAKDHVASKQLWVSQELANFTTIG